MRHHRDCKSRAGPDGDDLYCGGACIASGGSCCLTPNGDMPCAPNNTCVLNYDEYGGFSICCATAALTLALALSLTPPPAMALILTFSAWPWPTRSLLGRVPD